MIPNSGALLNTTKIHRFLSVVSVPMRGHTDRQTDINYTCFAHHSRFTGNNYKPKRSIWVGTSVVVKRFSLISFSRINRTSVNKLNFIFRPFRNVVIWLHDDCKRKTVERIMSIRDNKTRRTITHHYYHNEQLLQLQRVCYIVDVCGAADRFMNG